MTEITHAFTSICQICNAGVRLLMLYTQCQLAHKDQRSPWQTLGKGMKAGRTKNFTTN